jgi:hypothetical protein
VLLDEDDEVPDDILALVNMNCDVDRLDEDCVVLLLLVLPGVVVDVDDLLDVLPVVPVGPPA